MYPTMQDVHYAHPAPTTARPVTTGIPVKPTQTSTYYAPTGQETFQAQAPGPWSTGLCDCCGDVKNCCITCCCPCITFGQIAEIVDKGSTSCGASGALYTLIFCVTGCQCIYSCFYRSKMRQQYGLQKRPCNDCLVHCCCECCALCQEYRELKRRGFDMHIGWHANMEKRGVGATIPPVIQQSMTRFEIPVEGDAESDNTFRRQF